MIDCMRVYAHRETEDAGLSDESVEGMDELGAGKVGLDVECKDRFDVCINDTDDEIYVIGEVGGKGEMAGLIGIENRAYVNCVVRVAIETYWTLAFETGGTRISE
jgi:hypothetical protein